jgi:YtfJ family uncharacterized protein
MSIRTLILLVSLLTPFAQASDILPGNRLPDLDIAEKGELVLSGDEVGYRAWNYPQQPGKVHVLQYMAATRAASNINMPFTDRMKSELPQGAFLSTTILNLDEAMWGTGGLVVSELKSNKKEFPNAVLVADADGVGRQKWQLDKENSAVIVTDPQGVVRYFKQGAMSEAEIASTLQLVLQYIGASGQSAAAPAGASSAP